MSNSNALLSNPLALYDILQKAYTEMFFPIFFSFSIPFYLFNVSIHNLFAHSLINEYINDKKISYKRYWNCRVFVDLYINYDTAWSNNASFSYLSGGFYPPFMLDEHENCSNIEKWCMYDLSALPHLTFNISTSQPISVSTSGSVKNPIWNGTLCPAVHLHPVATLTRPCWP